VLTSGNHLLTEASISTRILGPNPTTLEAYRSVR